MGVIRGVILVTYNRGLGFLGGCGYAATRPQGSVDQKKFAATRLSGHAARTWTLRNRHSLFSLRLFGEKIESTQSIRCFELLNFQEIFKNDGLSSRPPELNWFNEYFRYGNGTDSRGLVFSQGSEWTEQRRFALRNLRFVSKPRPKFKENVSEWSNLLWFKFK